MSVFSKCCVLLGRGPCYEPIPHPEESYRVCVTECEEAQHSPSEQVEEDGLKKIQSNDRQDFEPQK